MKEPFETLLGQYRDHWMLAPYLAGVDVPNVRSIQQDERWWCLSAGEMAMVAAAGALLRLNEVWLAVDETNRRRIETAIKVMAED